MGMLQGSFLFLLMSLNLFYIYFHASLTYPSIVVYSSRNWCNEAIRGWYAAGEIHTSDQHTPSIHHLAVPLTHPPSLPCPYHHRNCHHRSTLPSSHPIIIAPSLLHTLSSPHPLIIIIIITCGCIDRSSTHPIVPPSPLPRSDSGTPFARSSTTPVASHRR